MIAVCDRTEKPMSMQIGTPYWLRYWYMAVWIGLCGCWKHTSSVENTPNPSTIESIEQISPSWLHMLDSGNAHRTEHYQTILGLSRLSSVQRRDIIQTLWSDPDPYVRMSVTQFLYHTYTKTDDTTELQELLAMGYQVDLSMEEKCRLAMQLYSLDSANREKYITHWKILSTGTLEEQYTCAIAGNYILHVSSPLHSLFAKGDFPLSINFVEDLLLYTQNNDVSVLEDNLQWAEEEMFGLLFMVVLQHSMQYPQSVPPKSSNVSLGVWREQPWSATQCLDVVDVAWRYPSSVYTEMLGDIANGTITYTNNTAIAEKEMCATVAKMALFSITGAYNSVVDGYIQQAMDGDREMVALAMQSLILAYQYRNADGSIFVSKRAENSLVKAIEKVVEYDQDPLILQPAIQVLNLWGHASSLRHLKELSQHPRIDPEEQFWAEMVLWNHNYLDASK